MKKTTAAVTATALGVVAVAGGAAGSAQALPSTSCTSSTQHQVTNGTPDADWYMDCVPLYGMGKVDFSISSPDIDFPAGFLPLTDPGVTATTDLPAGVAGYLGVTLTRGAFVQLNSGGPGGPDTSTTQNYNGYVAAKITGVGSYDLSNLPTADCTGTYTNAYTITYGSVTTTFTQVVDGQTWTFPVVLAPGPIHVAFTPDFTTGAVTGDVCAWSDTMTPVHYAPADSGYNSVAQGVITTDGGNPPNTLFYAPLFGTPIGGFVGTHVPVAVPVTPAAPTLAATGTDDALPIFAGGALAVLGALTLAFASIRRRRTQSR